MKNLIFTLAVVFAAYSAGMAQCNALWMGWSNPNLEAFFTDSSGLDPNVTTYFWNFGDGNTSTDQNPTHQYAAEGDYGVCLTVNSTVNGSACSNTYCDSLLVYTAPFVCSAGFSYSPSVNNSLQISFNNQSTNPGVPVYLWTFGDGTTSTNRHVSHTYSSAGSYNVCLTVSFVYSGTTYCSDTYCTTVTVQGPPPTCSAVFGHQEVGLTATFNGNTSDYSHLWVFGDGDSSTQQNPVHTYGADGTYNVCLTITHNTNGCTDTYCTDVTVTGPAAPTCTASFNHSAGQASNSVNFTGTPNGPYYALYEWDFGDGNTLSDTSSHAYHVYAAPGWYIACLTVTEFTPIGGIACTHTICDSVNASVQITTSNNLYGIVFSDSSNGTFNEALVYLIQYDSINETLTAIDSVMSQGGFYFFGNVSAGQYLLKAAISPNYPAYLDFLPTYYQSSLHWYNAATVTVPTALNLYHNIYMIAGNNVYGPGFIGGNVNQGANKQATGDPLENVQVMLLDMSDNPLRYTYTAADGGFSFEDVAYGTYKVYAEVLGKPTYPSIVTISATNERAEEVAIVVEEGGVYSSVTEVSDAFLGQANFYPNPVSSIGTVTFNAKEAGNLTLQVVNMLGQVVAEQEMNVLPGNQLATVDMSGQQAGVYFLTISFNNHVAAHLRFIRD